MSKIKTLFIFEKPSQLEKFKKSKIFNQLSKEREIHTHYAHCVVPYLKFKYPKNKKYKEYPLIKDLDYKLIYKEGKGSYLNSYKNLNKENLLTFSDIVFAVDLDRSGAYCSNNELSFILGENYRELFNKVYNIDINDINFGEKIPKTFLSEEFRIKELKNFDRLVEEGFVKKYFDYNYQLNANIFLKELYFSIFTQNEDIYIKHGFSKYMIQTVFLLNYLFLEGKKINEAALLKKMSNYSGSGKYNHEKSYSFIGTPASMALIISNLKDLGIIENSENKFLKFSKNGELFKDLLNKKLYDPDLNIRIENWCRQGLKSKKAIDRYILSVFSAQKRKNRYLNK